MIPTLIAKVSASDHIIISQKLDFDGMCDEEEAKQVMRSLCLMEMHGKNIRLVRHTQKKILHEFVNT